MTNINAGEVKEEKIIILKIECCSVDNLQSLLSIFASKLQQSIVLSKMIEKWW